MQLFSSWTGSDFLLVYIALLVACGFAAWWLPIRLRPSGRHGESPDAEDVAMLNGGSGAHTDSLLADLLARGALAEAEKGCLRVTDPGHPTSPAGRALLALRDPFTPGEASRLLVIHQNRIAARLRRMGLLLGDDQLWRLRWIATAPFIALLLFGLYRQREGSALGEATGMLELLLGLTLVAGVIRFLQIDARTAAGIAALRDLRAEKAQLRQSPPANEAGMAVALFGTAALVGSPWAGLHALRRSTGDGGASASSDTSGGDCDGGGGGDGGGCGD